MAGLFTEYPYLKNNRIIIRKITEADAEMGSAESSCTLRTLNTHEDLQPVKVEQFVMAYLVEQDRIRAMLPEGYRSLRPVLRINTEIRNGHMVYVEFNTPVEADGRRGWLNIANWKSTHDDIGFTITRTNVQEPAGGGASDGKTGADGAVDAAQTDTVKARRTRTVTISSPFLTLTYTGSGIQGGCPAEKDNDGCYYLGSDKEFRPAEKIDRPKEFCDCEFSWHFHEGDAHGVSERKTLPAYEEAETHDYPNTALTAENAAAIPCRKVLGSYIVRFIRRPSAE